MNNIFNLGLWGSMLALICSSSTSFAASVVSLTVEDVGSGLPGNYSSTLDGVSGAFRFSPINDSTFIGTSFFTGDIAADPGPGMGEIDTSQANPALSFTSGFEFLSQPFVPLTEGPIVADISMSGGVPTMTVDSLPFGGIYGNSGGTLFSLGSQVSAPADCAGLPIPWQPLSVHWVEQMSANQFKYKIGWSHCITFEEDLAFGGLLAYWRLEGIATTATAPEVPLPAAVWLFGSGIIGLMGIARRRTLTKA